MGVGFSETVAMPHKAAVLHVMMHLSRCERVIVVVRGALVMTVFGMGRKVLSIGPAHCERQEVALRPQHP